MTLFCQRLNWRRLGLVECTAMRIVLMLLLVCLPTTAFCRTVGGIEMPDTRTLQEQTLTLNGAGIRSKYFMEVYVAGLYLPEPSQDADAIVTADALQSMRLHIISSHITRSRLIDTIEEGIQQSSGKEFPRYKPMLNELWDALTFEVKVGDIFEFTYVPGKGTHFYRNGELLRVLPEFDFKKVLFGIWLGRNPVQDSLKRKLVP
jgi:hypothetical protein